MRKLGFGEGTTSTQQSQLTQSWKLPKGAIYDRCSRRTHGWRFACEHEVRGEAGLCRTPA